MVTKAGIKIVSTPVIAAIIADAVLVNISPHTYAEIGKMIIIAVTHGPEAMLQLAMLHKEYLNILGTGLFASGVLGMVLYIRNQGFRGLGPK